MPKALITQEISLRTATLHRVRVPLIEPFRISNGAVVEKDVIVVQVTTEEGITDGAKRRRWVVRFTLPTLQRAHGKISKR